MPDLFLVCETPSSHRRSYQIWVNDKDGGFSLVRSGALPDGVGAITFADMSMSQSELPAITSNASISADRDGTIDILFPTCDSVTSAGVGTNCKINIAFNKQLPLCKSSTDKNCRSPEKLCTADSNFSFDFGSSDPNVRR